MFRIPYAVLFLATLLAPLRADAVQRAFVASYGSDANTATNCAPSTPCRSFASALTAVDSGGEIVALDAAGYSAVTINKSVTIASNPGFYAGVAAPVGAGITVNGSGVNVTLRGLHVNGTGGGDGIVVLNAAKVTIENCIVSNFLGAGFAVINPVSVTIVDSVFRGNATAGVYITDGAVATLSNVQLLGNPNYGLLVYSGPGSTTFVSLANSVISGSTGGARAESFSNGETVRLAVSRSTISNNATGIASVGSAGFSSVVVSDTTVTGSGTSALLQSGTTSAFHSLGNNTLTHNLADKTGTISSLALQ